MERGDLYRKPSLAALQPLWRCQPECYPSALLALEWEVEERSLNLGLEKGILLDLRAVGGPNP